MAAQLDREGTFRAKIVDYGLKKGKDGSQSVAVSVKFVILEHYNFNTEEWEDWRGYEEHEVWGNFYVVKADGNLGDFACRALIKNCGWDGYLESVLEKTWEVRDCQISVGVNEWKGKTSYRAEFVNDWNDTPGGGVSNVGVDEVKALSARLGGPLRALAGTVANAAKKPPNGKPASPPPTKKPEPVAAASEGGGTPDDEIPFDQAS